MRQLIGRQKEITVLDICMKSDRSEFITVCGRRRIGKTYLVEQYFEGKFAFNYVGGHKLTKLEQLDNFRKALERYGDGIKLPKVKDWFSAFDALQVILEHSRCKRKVVFIDEMPWIDTKKSKFVAALENFWNGWAMRRNDIVFIASGSATSWMSDKLKENQGGLHNRITYELYLNPFSLKETEQYLDGNKFNWDRYSILQTYMILGGVPYYLSLLRPDMSLPQNVDELFFDKNGKLRNEFEELYPALFSDADKYIGIVRALYSKREGMIRNEIIQATGHQGRILTKMLSNLEKCDFISEFANFGNTTKGTIYRLTDMYSLFYLRFIEKDRSKDTEWWSHSIGKPTINTWQGLAFEQVCMGHLEQIKDALKIGGIATETTSWRNNSAQIDMVIKRADRCINICEMKFSTLPFEISAEYAQKARERMAEFKATTKTRYALISTFITTYGVKSGKHSSIVQSQLTMDDLFL